MVAGFHLIWTVHGGGCRTIRAAAPLTKSVSRKSPSLGSSTTEESPFSRQAAKFEASITRPATF